MLRLVRSVGHVFGARDAQVDGTARGLSLRANFSWTLAGNVVYAACQWGMLTALAKLGTPEMVGQFSLGLAVGAPVFMLANLHLRAVQATDARKEYAFGDYLALRLITSVLAFLVVAGIAGSGGYQRETALAIVALGLVKVFQSLGDVLHGLLQRHERMDRIAQALMLRGPLTLLVLATLVLVTRTVFWGGVGMALVYALVLMTYERQSASLVLKGVAGNEGVLRPRWGARRLLALAWLALPLGLVKMLIALNANIPRYAIERGMGERELGIFAAMAYLHAVGSTAVGALGQSASPRLANYYARGDRHAFRSLLFRLVRIGAALGAAGVIVALGLGRQVLTLLYRPEYAEQPEVLVCLMVAAGLDYVASCLGHGMTAARRFRPQLPIYVTVAAVTTLCSLFWVPSRGTLGAAWALALSSLINCGLSALVVLRALERARAPATTERG